MPLPFFKPDLKLYRNRFIFDSEIPDIWMLDSNNPNWGYDSIRSEFGLNLPCCNNFDETKDCQKNTYFIKERTTQNQNFQWIPISKTLSTGATVDRFLDTLVNKFFIDLNGVDLPDITIDGRIYEIIRLINKNEKLSVDLNFSSGNPFLAFNLWGVIKKSDRQSQTGSGQEIIRLSTRMFWNKTAKTMTLNLGYSPDWNSWFDGNYALSFTFQNNSFLLGYEVSTGSHGVKGSFTIGNLKQLQTGAFTLYPSVAWNDVHIRTIDTSSVTASGGWPYPSTLPTRQILGNQFVWPSQGGKYKWNGLELSNRMFSQSGTITDDGIDYFINPSYNATTGNYQITVTSTHWSFGGSWNVIYKFNNWWKKDIDVEDGKIIGSVTLQKDSENILSGDPDIPQVQSITWKSDESFSAPTLNPGISESDFFQVGTDVLMQDSETKIPLPRYFDLNISGFQNILEHQFENATGTFDIFIDLNDKKLIRLNTFFFNFYSNLVRWENEVGRLFAVYKPFEPLENEMFWIYSFKILARFTFNRNGNCKLELVSELNNNDVVFESEFSNGSNNLTSLNFTNEGTFSGNEPISAGKRIWNETGSLSLTSSLEQADWAKYYV